MFNVQWAVCIVQCAVCSVQYALSNKQCVVFSVLLQGRRHAPHPLLRPDDALDPLLAVEHLRRTVGRGRLPAPALAAERPRVQRHDSRLCSFLREEARSPTQEAGGGDQRVGSAG